LAGKIDWDWIDSEIAPLYSESGRPGIPARALRPEPLAQSARHKLELLLAEILRVAYEAGGLRSQDLKRVTVDTTVQPKAITFPPNSKSIYHLEPTMRHVDTRAFRNNLIARRPGASGSETT